MPSNHKGKGMKGRNYDELSGVGTSRAGKAGTTPDLADEDNLQSAGNRQSGGQGSQQADQQQNQDDSGTAGRSRR